MDDEFQDHVVGNQILYDKEGNAVLIYLEGGLPAIATRDTEQIDILNEIKRELRVIRFCLSQIVDIEIFEEDLED